jgi:hypothetical protein
MSKQNCILLTIALALIGSAGGLLNHLHAHQKLGAPGVKTSPIPGSIRLQVELPPRVLDYDSKPMEEDKVVLGVLPQDTSFGRRLYTANDGFQVMMDVVLMGGDRTSLHKPQFCLEGAGWHIDQVATTQTTIPMRRPCAYDLPVVKLLATRQRTVEAITDTVRGVYVYWYVADGAVSASTSGVQRMWWMARDLLRTGKLQRWAYVTCFSMCAPGQEDATFERMKTFITSSVPDFQLTPRAPQATASAN